MHRIHLKIYVQIAIIFQANIITLITVVLKIVSVNDMNNIEKTEGRA